MADIKQEYYAPNIGGFRIGYYYEVSMGMKVNADTGEMEETWGSLNMDLDTNLRELQKKIDENMVRVPFLIDSDFVVRGWAFVGAVIPMNQTGVTQTSPQTKKYDKGNHSIVYDYFRRILMLFFAKGEIVAVKLQHYHCPSVNELDYMFLCIDMQD